MSSKQALDDNALMKQVAQGSTTAFSLLMQRHLAAVLIFCKRYLQQEAEDIAQEAFIRLWNQAENWQNQGISVKAWLFRVSYNLCIDELRKNKLSFFEDESQIPIEQDFNITEQQHSAENDLQRQLQLLKHLPERQRTAVMLTASYDVSHKEVAQILNISVDALEALLARGRAKLRQLFDKDAA